MKPRSKSAAKKNRSNQTYFQAIYLATVLLSGSAISWHCPAWAAPLPPNTTIDNTPTGSFVDELDLTNTDQTVTSNTATLKVGEVAGITIAPLNTPTATNGSVANFDFTITNVGNDPTKFFLPTAPSAITGGTAGTLQVVGYQPAGGAVTNLATPINITTATDTGSLGDVTLGGNTTLGSIPAGAAIVVRVPVTVTAAAGSPVTVTLGNTGGQPSASNTPYVLGANGSGTNDLYTFDNADGTITGEAGGAPINGDATGHRQEASATRTVNAVAPATKISGTVFEDINYGGGAGRDLATSSGSVRQGARVELYDSTGAFKGFTTTNISGVYTFDNTNITGGILGGDYTVRVVNSSVTSSRPGAVSTLLPVQTFRVNDSTGTPANDVNRVGGEKPSVADTGAAGAGAVLNTTTFAFTTAGGSATLGGQAQSIAPVKVGSSAVTGIDFGYNFDTIVNTNDSGQGSLRQFITNSNTLTNTGLAQVGQPAGKEVSIFMIPGQAGLALGSPTTSAPATGGLRIGLANQLTNGVAKIAPTSVLPPITDNNTSIDGTTQTTLVGDTNSGKIGTGGKVGTGTDGREGTGDEPTLSLINKPEVEIKGNGSSMAIGLDLVGNNETVRGIAIYGFGVSGGGSGSSQADVFSRGTGEVIQSNTFGFPADSFADPGAASRTQTNHIGLGLNSETTITNNMIAFALHRGIDSSETQLVKMNITNNEIRENNRNDGYAGGGIELSSFGSAFGGSASNSISPQGTISGNLITKNTVTNKGGADNGIEFNGTAGNLLITIEDNTISNNGTGVVGYSFKSPTPLVNNITISHNVITDNYGSGIGIRSLNGLKITQNAIYKNVGLGIDLLARGNNGAYTTDTSTNRPGNNEIDYPIITNSTLSAAGVLTVSGFVGSNPAGSATFKNAKLEFFVADNSPADQNGEVILGDGKSKPHGEGRTYIGACTADGNGLFGTATNPCVLSNVPAALTDPNNITATATDTSGNTSEFSAPPSNLPKLLLVKRITAINPGKPDEIKFDAFENDPNSDNDDHPFWPDPDQYLQGAVNPGKVKPGDEVEYTVYFLSNGQAKAKQVQICDVVPKHMTFVKHTYGVEQGIGLGFDTTVLPTEPNLKPSNSLNDDQGEFYARGTTPPSNLCKKVDASGTPVNVNGTNNDDGAVVIKLPSLPQANGAGDPIDSYGFIRFRARVK